MKIMVAHPARALDKIEGQLRPQYLVVAKDLNFVGTTEVELFAQVLFELRHLYSQEVRTARGEIVILQGLPASNGSKDKAVRAQSRKQEAGCSSSRPQVVAEAGRSIAAPDSGSGGGREGP